MRTMLSINALSPHHLARDVAALFPRAALTFRRVQDSGHTSRLHVLLGAKSDALRLGGDFLFGAGWKHTTTTEARIGLRCAQPQASRRWLGRRPRPAKPHAHHCGSVRSLIQPLPRCALGCERAFAQRGVVRWWRLVRRSWAELRGLNRRLVLHYLEHGLCHCPAFSTKYG